MNEDPKGGDLFIVDNSISGWTALRYLTEWAELAKSFDVATGYFEIGGLLAMQDKWQQLDKIRILMGDETTARSKKAILEAVRSNAEARLDDSLEAEKANLPFLDGVPAIEAALRDGRIECRVYNKDKFHAKAYITHAKVDVIGAQALVGSSNFTRPGPPRSRKPGHAAGLFLFSTGSAVGRIGERRSPLAVRCARSRRFGNPSALRAPGSWPEERHLADAASCL
jgi:hypothetical protein